VTDADERAPSAPPTERPGPRIDRPAIPAEYGIPSSTDGLLPWSHVEGRLHEARVIWIATSGPGGVPHARPVDALYVDGALWIGGSPETRWVRDLEANPRASVHLGSGMDVVILEGEVEHLANGAPTALAARLAAASNAKFPEYGLKPSDYEGPGVRAFRPRVAFAWTAFPEDVTRFRFDRPDAERGSDE
jgi:hypothetical protein